MNVETNVEEFIKVRNLLSRDCIELNPARRILFPLFTLRYRKY